MGVTPRRVRASCLGAFDWMVYAKPRAAGERLFLMGRNSWRAGLLLSRQTVWTARAAATKPIEPAARWMAVAVVFAEVGDGQYGDALFGGELGERREDFSHDRVEVGIAGADVGVDGIDDDQPAVQCAMDGGELGEVVA